MDPKTRHEVAGTGKDLPDDAPADAEDDRTEADAPFAWFGMAPPAPEAAPAIVAFAAAGAVELPEGDAAALAEIPLPEGLTDPAAGDVAKAIEAFDLTGIPAPETAPETTPGASVRQIQGLDISRLGRADGSARIELPATSPILQTLAALQPGGDANPLAATLASVGIELPEQFRRPAPRETAIATLTPLNGLELQRPNVVQAVADVQQAAIDMRRSDWMSSTIDRIEALRDSPNSRETSIRLSPDALGNVDVSIRQEGDRIHVRFAAETAQARALLTEAQSRLTEIAEARGLKLGQTSVDAGTAGNGGNGQRQDAAPKPNVASAPASALGAGTESTTEERIA